MIKAESRVCGIDVKHKGSNVITSAKDWLTKIIEQ